MERWQRLCYMMLARQACREAQCWWARASDRTAKLGQIAAQRRLIFQGLCAARGHGPMSSERQPHERRTFECTVCGLAR
uniref:Uncharacterized protein n=1 Tax=viral metagenome TaxID=1070528 RepID=A0A6C0KFE6_9ZZZZ